MGSRLAKEYVQTAKTLRNDPAFSHVLALAPVSDDVLNKWEATIEGPPQTAYYGYQFKLQIEVDQNYPIKPPWICFEPQTVPHCNVDYDSGRICLNLLDADHWSPAWDLLHSINAIWQLLANPEPDSPLDIDLACLFRTKDYCAHDSLVRYYLNGGSRGSTGPIRGTR
ncbi:LAME_0F09978g1_1 [Lachancea meyersii CBS 8951]|uniref:LAME_0F09978g1_1 n=1 Tax=Lachancea meyersii CBS 8951 TaxID=1266667 RepID=A0A1G4JV90_9SACH|nr:LAME_0F09978g1_1 [Lachancea meyersii CBS 8951]